MDERQFDALYEREWSRLVGQLTVVCGDRAEAADCVQEAFVRAWERRDGLTGDAAGWVRTTAVRLAVSRWRRARNAVTAWTRVARQPITAGDPGLQAFDGQLWQALRDLPAAQREAVALHHLLDLAVAEVAELLGVPEGTVKARLSRGRAALAGRLTAGQAEQAGRRRQPAVTTTDGGVS